MSNQLTVLSNQLASHFNLGDGTALIDTLKKTAFKGGATDEQMAALLIMVMARIFRHHHHSRAIPIFGKEQ